MEVMVVDRDINIRTTILNDIPWIELNCSLPLTVENDMQGFNKVVQSCPDCIITDIDSPESRGFSFIEKVLQYNEECQFVVLSKKADFENARKAMQFGIRDYLLKPLDIGELTRSLQRITHKEMKHDFQDIQSGCSIVDDVIAYIREHFDNAQLSLSWIAQNVIYKNKDYLGKLIKNTLNKSFNQYLNEYRIQKAMTIINDDPEIRLYDLAEKIGYPEDGHYLSAQFKKINGVTITSFRNKRQNQLKSRIKSTLGKENYTLFFDKSADELIPYMNTNQDLGI